MTLFRRSLTREFATLSAGTCAVLLAILLSTQVVRLMGKAASGAIQAEGVLAFLAFGVLAYLPIVLTLTLFFSVLMTLSRWYADSEMVVWFSSGLGLGQWVRPVLTAAAPVALVVAALSLGLSPWSLRQSAAYQRQLDSKDDLSIISPGVFRESRQADRVFFVENLSGNDTEINNVFVQSTQSGRQGVMVARRGIQQIMANGDKFLVLEHGRRYEGTPGTSDYKFVDFDRYSLRVQPYEAKEEKPSPKSLATPKLLKEPTRPNMAEFHWRIAQPISVLVLALAAIPMSFANPRGGRSINLIVAVLVYIIYNNLLSIFQAWIDQGKVSTTVGLWPVHLGMLLLMGLMFYHRSLVGGITRVWPRRAA